MQLGFSAKDQDYYVCYGFNTSGGIYAPYIYVCVSHLEPPPPHTVLLPSPLIHWVGKAEAAKEFEETTLERHIGDSGQDGSS